MNPPRVSILLVTRNGASTLPALIEALAGQRVAGGLEIVAIDSGSTDGTPDLLAPRAASFARIDVAAFDHGTTRNLAAAHARGEYLILLAQDARPIGGDWIERLVRPLAADPRVAGAFARQVPRPEASRLARHYLARWVAAGDEPAMATLPGGSTELEALRPIERLRRCAFDNVASCLRRSVWEAHPFAATPIAEDLEWAKRVLLAGHAIAFVPDAVVVHSHDRPVAYEYARTRALHARLFELFGLRTIPSTLALGRAVASSLALHARLEWHRPDRWPRAAALAVAWPLAQYVGARRAKCGLAARPRPGTV